MQRTSREGGIDIKSAWEDMRFVVPREDSPEVQRDTRLTSEEEKILKRARDIAEKKTEECKRHNEKETEQDRQGIRKKSPESSSDDPRMKRKQKEREKDQEST